MHGKTFYTLEQVSVNNGKAGAKTWIVINDLVYDVTEYIQKHPGGPELIEEYAGKDATAGFNDFGHSSDAKRMLKDFLVGELVEEDKMANRKKKHKIIDNAKTQKVVYTKRRLFLAKLCGSCMA